MKLLKKTRRYCPFCKKHTEQKIGLVSSGHKRSSMKYGSIERAKKRGLGRGYGNLGKWGSKPPITKWKRKTKSTKKTNLLYTCNICKKSYGQKKGMRVGKITLEEKAQGKTER
ncbi:50S ribosomal protein L44e [Candidatus Pacearchaeota archaeon]|nr:50S ribosomal protein L44e [Candidatus Pacearchaeota archaeon]